MNDFFTMGSDPMVSQNERLLYHGVWYAEQNSAELAE